MPFLGVCAGWEACQLFFPRVTILSFLFVLPALPQSLEDFSEECVLACLLEQTDPPKGCDCQAVIAAADAAGPPPSDFFPNGLPTASDLIYEAKAQYDARMADINDYYFVEQTVIDTGGAGLTMPGFFQMPGDVIPTMPIVRFFMGELNSDGEKVFKEVGPADLARMDPSVSESEAAALGGAEMLNEYGKALEAIAGAMPGVAQQLTEALGGGFKNVGADIKQQNENDALTGDQASDGFGMAVEQEMIRLFAEDSQEVPVYKAYYFVPIAGLRSPPFRLHGEYLGRTGEEAWQKSCANAACGNPGGRLGHLSGGRIHTVWVLRKEASSDTESEIAYEGRIYDLRYAEIWLVDMGGEEFVVARRRMEYWTNTNVGVEQVAIDQYTEGFEERSGMLAPTSSTQTIEGLAGAASMKVKKFFSELKTNEGPPTQQTIRNLISEAMQNPEFSNPNVQ